MNFHYFLLKYEFKKNKCTLILKTIKASIFCLFLVSIPLKLTKLYGLKGGNENAVCTIFLRLLVVDNSYKFVVKLRRIIILKIPLLDSLIIFIVSS